MYISYNNIPTNAKATYTINFIFLRLQCGKKESNEYNNNNINNNINNSGDFKVYDDNIKTQFTLR